MEKTRIRNNELYMLSKAEPVEASVAFDKLRLHRHNVHNVLSVFLFIRVIPPTTGSGVIER